MLITTVLFWWPVEEEKIVRQSQTVCSSYSSVSSRANKWSWRRDGETERQRDRETERQIDRETERQRDRETERQRDGETDRQRDRETARQKDRETERQRDRETERQGDRETERQGDRETGRQRDRDRNRDGDRDRERENGDIEYSVCIPCINMELPSMRITFFTVQTRDRRKYSRKAEFWDGSSNEVKRRSKRQIKKKAKKQEKNAFDVGLPICGWLVQIVVWQIVHKGIENPLAKRISCPLLSLPQRCLFSFLFIIRR